jgi:hypothetical protein
MAVSRGIRRFWYAHFAVVLMLGACTTTPPPDPAAQLAAEQAKAQTLGLIDQSGQKFSTRQNDVNALIAKYDASASAAALVPMNELVIQAWGIIRGPQSGSAVEYFNTWKQRGVMRPVIRAEKKAQIGRHFDYLICVEAAKQGSGATCPNPGAVAPSAPPISADDPAEGSQ